MKTLSEKTKVSIGLAVVAIGGGAMWLTTLYWNTAANAKEIVEIKSDQKEFYKVLNSIDKRLSNIEGAVGVGED